MTSYERVKMALNHKEPDKIPFDIGGSVLTGMNKTAYINLRKHLGMSTDNVQIYDEMQQLARIDDDMVDRLQVDVRCVDPDMPKKPGLRKPSKLVGDYYEQTDEWGIKWRMPAENGLYYDMLDGSLKEVNTVEELNTFKWPDPMAAERFATMKQRADHFVYNEERAYILGRQYAGIWETALWMSGFEKFFMDMILNKKYAHALMEKITELKMQYWEKALEAVGDNVLVISEADDLATQQGLLCSVDMYKEMVHPYHKKLFNFIREKAQNDVHIFYHTCGACKPLIPLLIDEGVDVLNPVQVNANGMDSLELKKEFGKDITFWGGGVDTQKILPFGTPAQVKEEVKMRIDHLAKDGGFIFNPVHNVQGDVPPENFIAMWEALQEFGKY